ASGSSAPPSARDPGWARSPSSASSSPPPPCLPSTTSRAAASRREQASDERSESQRAGQLAHARDPLNVGGSEPPLPPTPPTGERPRSSSRIAPARPALERRSRYTGGAGPSGRARPPTGALH